MCGGCAPQFCRRHAETNRQCKRHEALRDEVELLRHAQAERSSDRLAQKEREESTRVVKLTEARGAGKEVLLNFYFDFGCDLIFILILILILILNSIAAVAARGEERGAG